MKAEELKEILANHKLWLEDPNQRMLENADLRYADLRYTNLRYTNLENADLRYANLENADLRYTNLRYTDLRYANLRYTNLRNADLENARGLRMTPPEYGLFWIYKQVKYDLILLLEVPENAKRISHPGSRKLRVSSAIPRKVFRMDKSECYPHCKLISKWDPNFEYKLHERIEIPNYDDDCRIECAPGIHGYLSMQEAIEHV